MKLDSHSICELYRSFDATFKSDFLSKVQDPAWCRLHVLGNRHIELEKGHLQYLETVYF